MKIYSFFETLLANLLWIFFKLPYASSMYVGIYDTIVKKNLFFKDFSKTIKFQNRFLIKLNLGDWIQNQIYFLGSYEYFELKVLEKSLTLGDTFIDIGANFGLYSLQGAINVGCKGKVISFEPFSINYLACKDNIKLNNFKNIELVKLALGDQRKEISLSYNNKECNLGMVSVYENNFSEQEKVICDSLDNFLKGRETNVKYIKIDIEGQEYLALIGMRQTLNKYKPIVQLEIDDNILLNTEYSRLDIEKLMEELDYEVFFPEMPYEIRIRFNKFSKNCFYKPRTV